MVKMNRYSFGRRGNVVNSELDFQAIIEGGRALENLKGWGNPKEQLNLDELKTPDELEKREDVLITGRCLIVPQHIMTDHLRFLYTATYVLK